MSRFVDIQLQGQMVRRVQLDRDPDRCPICHVHVRPQSLVDVFSEKLHRIQCVYRCPNSKCDELFIATYVWASPSSAIFGFTAPLHYEPQKFSEEVSEVSPSFIKVYNQAMAAESHSLDQMVGIGLRKALEFLVKDFAIREKPEKAEDVKSAFLGRVINDYIEDKTVKALAARAAWLGNDETHYVRKWEDKDIKDLKALVKLTVNAVQNKLLGDKYIEDMNPR